jgi:S1-C subfamily serine protease
MNRLRAGREPGALRPQPAATRRPPQGRSAAAASALLTLALLLAACGTQRGTIGAVLGQSPEGELTVREVPNGLAADKAGLKPDDKILLIDGKDVRTLDAKGVHQALSGEVGDKVKLTVVRGEEVIRVTLSRTEAKRWSSRLVRPR